MRFEKVSLETFKKEMSRNGLAWMTEVEVEEAWEGIKLPERKTKGSAGYDFVLPVDVVVWANSSVIIPSGIKVFFDEDEQDYHLELHVRSSTGIRRGCVLSNGTAIVDSDYYGNEDNEGCVLIALYNRDDYNKKFLKGERVMQGVFIKHRLIEGDRAEGKRTGGVGSSGK